MLGTVSIDCWPGRAFVLAPVSVTEISACKYRLEYEFFDKILKVECRFVISSLLGFAPYSYLDHHDLKSSFLCLPLAILMKAFTRCRVGRLCTICFCLLSCVHVVSIYTVTVDRRLLKSKVLFEIRAKRIKDPRRGSWWRSISSACAVH